MRGNYRAGNFIKPIIPTRPPWFQQLNPCENAIAAFYTGVVSQPHPVAEAPSARPLLFSGDALSYMSFRPAQPCKNQIAG